MASAAIVAPAASAGVDPKTAESADVYPQAEGWTMAGRRAGKGARHGGGCIPAVRLVSPRPPAPILSGPKHLCAASVAEVPRKVVFNDSPEVFEAECPPWGGFKTQVIYGASSVKPTTTLFGSNPVIDGKKTLRS